MALREVRLPVVAVNSGVTDESGIGTVNTDDYSGSLLALHHLARLGHTASLTSLARRTVGTPWSGVAPISTSTPPRASCP